MKPTVSNFVIVVSEWRLLWPIYSEKRSCIQSASVRIGYSTSVISISSVNPIIKQIITRNILIKTVQEGQVKAYERKTYEFSVNFVCI